MNPETCRSARRGGTKSKALSQRTPKLPEYCLAPPIPYPKTQLLGLHYPSFGQNRHMMRNSRLGQVNTLLDIRSAQSHALANRTSTLFLEGAQNPPPGRIGDSVQNAI